MVKQLVRWSWRLATYRWLEDGDRVGVRLVELEVLPCEDHGVLERTKRKSQANKKERKHKGNIS